MIATTTQPVIAHEPFDKGYECEVFDTNDDNVVFKLYFSTPQVVMAIIGRNRDYAKCGFGPQVYSGMIKIDNKYGYYVERVLPTNKIPINDSIEFENQLVKELNIGIMRKCELYGNWGLTKDKRPVLLDFGPITMSILGLL